MPKLTSEGLQKRLDSQPNLLQLASAAYDMSIVTFIQSVASGQVDARDFDRKISNLLKLK